MLRFDHVMSVKRVWSRMFAMRLAAAIPRTASACGASVACVPVRGGRRRGFGCVRAGGVAGPFELFMRLWGLDRSGSVLVLVLLCGCATCDEMGSVCCGGPLVKLHGISGVAVRRGVFWVVVS